jgi:arylsulfatase A-like enzyme
MADDDRPRAADWTRRDVHRALLSSVALWACRADDDAVGPTDDAAPTPRGIVLITADDLGWRDVGAYGLTTVATPALDRLVAEGVAFDRAFDVVSSCSSSRATYLTGQYPHTHGVTGLVHRFPERSLPSTRPTVARHLAAAGFTTALQGKWHVSQVEPPTAFGYDTVLPTDVDQLIRTSDDARRWLGQHAAARFYLELNFVQTHRIPIADSFPQAPGFEVDPEAASPPAWWGLPDWPEIREEVAGYLSRLAWMDHLVGEVLDELDALGLADDTLVVFVSDNGPAFPGCKETLYDRGLGTPLAWRWPAALAPRRTDALFSSVDLAPTIVDLAGLPPLEAAQGRSWRPFLVDEPGFVPPEALFSEMEDHVGPVPARAVRTSSHKLVVNLSDAPWGSGDGHGAWKEALAQEPDQRFDEPRVPVELYDLEADPLERDDRADDPALADVRADLAGRLLRHLRDTVDPRLGEVEALLAP